MFRFPEDLERSSRTVSVLVLGQQGGPIDGHFVARVQPRPTGFSQDGGQPFRPRSESASQDAFQNALGLSGVVLPQVGSITGMHRDIFQVALTD